ncbi:MAG: DCC1-like thiol-disulfide oxidoreductase family protein [Caldilineaceae bacterium]
MSGERLILLFDGVCNLCNGTVKFIIARDAAGKFAFASLQSEVGTALLRAHNLRTDDFDSVVLVENGRIYDRSTAALRVAKGLGGVWALFYVLIVVPKPIRDAVYDFIAQPLPLVWSPGKLHVAE